MSIERYTFASILSNTADLPQLSEIIGKSPRRKNLIKELDFNINIPLYRKDRRRRFEREREQFDNLAAFLRDGSRSAYSAHRALGVSGAHTDPRSVTKDVEDPGHIPYIHTLKIAQTGRHIDRKVVSVLVERIRHLRRLDLKFLRMQRRRKYFIARRHERLAEALESLLLDRVETLGIWLSEHAPRNHDFEIADARDPEYPKADRLNRAVFKLAQQRLRELYIDESWPISPALFGACDKRQAPTFPYLKTMEVTFPIVTYNGRWLYKGHPDDIKEDDDSEEGPSLDNPRSKESDGEFSLPADYEDELEYFTSLVQATLGMPRLQQLSVKTTERGVKGNEIEMEVLVPGVKSDVIPWDKVNTAYMAKRRWVVALGGDADWKIPDDISKMMQEAVGRDREVTVFGWKSVFLGGQS
ncbi:hypothetical protein BJX65DRAFT_312184 [Aspergillus insuetus]